MSHVTSLHEKIQKSKFSWSAFFKLNTLRHELRCTAFHHRRVHSMSHTVWRAVAKELISQYLSRLGYSYQFNYTLWLELLTFAKSCLNPVCLFVLLLLFLLYFCLYVDYVYYMFIHRFHCWINIGTCDGEDQKSLSYLVLNADSFEKFEMS